MRSRFNSGTTALFLAPAQAAQHLIACIYVAHNAALRAQGTTGPAQPLRDWPLVVKDNIDVAGMPTTAGSRALSGHVPATP